MQNYLELNRLLSPVLLSPTKVDCVSVPLVPLFGRVGPKNLLE